MSQQEPRVLVVCSDGEGCGSYYEVAARVARRIRRGERQPICPSCRREALLAKQRGPITYADRQFWIERFGHEGAVELALSIWGTEIGEQTQREAVAAATG